MIEPLTIIGLGELLWDVFPSGRQLGGAPANFAYCSNLLGDTGIVVSRIGADESGNDIRESLSTFGLTDDFLQIDRNHPTGVVNVKLDLRGQPDFEIKYPAAWDFLEWNESLRRLARSTDAVSFGSLAQRSTNSRQTIRSFLDSVQPTCTKIFDVNLRQSFYSAEVLEDSISRATIVKLNVGELPPVADMLQVSSHDPGAFGREVLRRFSAKLICVTRGKAGSLLVDANGVYEHPGFRVKVRDTVGSGDAFTAALVHQYLRGVPIAAANDFANRMGAWVASCPGAMPPAPDGGLERALARLDQADLP